MSRPYWVTPGGNLGTVPQLEFYELPLEVIDPTNAPVTFSFLSGELPPGIQVVKSGVLQGVPVITNPIKVDETRQYNFTVRATAQRTAGNIVVDRSFSLTINNVFPPIITPRVRDLGATFDGQAYSKQLDAIEENPAAILEWSVVEGSLPPGLTLSNTGLISGYILLEPAAYEAGTQGYDGENTSAQQPFDEFPYDFSGRSRNKNYTFTVQVSDGANYDNFTYNLLVVSKGLYTADQDAKINLTYFKGTWDPTEDYFRGNTLFNSDVVRYDYQYYVARSNIAGNPSNTNPTINNSWIRFGEDIYISVDNDYVTVDADNRYVPIITTGQSLPDVRQESNFAFKFEALDFEGDDIGWTISLADGSGFDQNGTRIFPADTVRKIVWFDDSNEGTFDSNNGTISFTVNTEPYSDLVNDYTPTVTINGAVSWWGNTYVQSLTEGTDFTISGQSIIVNANLANAIVSGSGRIGANIKIEPEANPGVVTGTGFDYALFDQSASKLPPVLSIDPDTGWLYGTISPQTEFEKTYNFIISAFKKDAPSYVSDPVSYKLKVLGNTYDQVVWLTNTDLGTIVNGSISELNVEAVSTLSKKLVYSLSPGYYQRLPQGLEVLENGLISGRASFRHFTLDNGAVTFDKNTTFFDNLYQFTIRAETLIPIGDSYPSDPTINDYAIRTDYDPIRLYKYTSSGWVNQTRVTRGFVFPSENYAEPDLLQDKDYFLFDEGGTYKVYQYSDEAVSWIPLTVSADRTFNVRIDNRYRYPYENLYLKAFPTKDQRQFFEDIVNNQDIFPDNLLYRKEDPWFGRAKELRFLEVAGVNPSSLEEYVTAIQNNHYWKRINFGEVKTAIAVDEFRNTKYEVVYVEAQDPLNTGNKNVRELVDLTGVINPFIDNDQSYSLLYPNTLENMGYRVTNGIGYSARGLLPDWMTSVQPNKSVLGFTRAIVLAYTVPGASKLIAYRLRDNGIAFNQIDFTVDRYLLDNALSANYNTSTDEFVKSKETTFDQLILGTGSLDGATVDYAVNQPFDSINARTINYINQNGGIDGVTGFSTGDTLIFARQEKYFNETGPNDGWNDYRDLYLGNSLEDLDTDSYYDVDRYDDYSIVPGYREKQQNILNFLLQTTTPAGSNILYVPYVVGDTYVGKSVEAFSGLLPNTFVTAQAIDTVGGNTVTKLTINNLATVDMTAGSAVTLKSSFSVATNSSGFILTPSVMPADIRIGCILTGVNIPENTVVTDVTTTTIRVNNSLGSSVTAGTVVSYAISNQRAGVWKVVIKDNIVTLDFVQEIELGQKVKVLNGITYGYTFLTYNPVLDVEQTVPAYTRWVDSGVTSTDFTTFDGNGTRFFDSRDSYTEPGANDKYIKFPQIGVFT